MSSDAPPSYGEVVTIGMPIYNETGYVWGAVGLDITELTRGSRKTTNLNLSFLDGRFQSYIFILGRVNNYFNHGNFQYLRGFCT